MSWKTGNANEEHKGKTLLQNDIILKKLRAADNHASSSVLKHYQDIVDGNFRPRDTPSVYVGNSPTSHNLSTPICSVVSPTLNVNPTLFVIPCDFLGTIDWQCCNFCLLPSDFSSKFKPSTIIFHHKLLTKEGRVLTNECTRPSSMTIFVHLFIISVIRTIAIVALNIIISVVSTIDGCKSLEV
jgi:hypothetical protein